MDRVTPHGEPWYLPVGETLTPPRARAIVGRFGPEVRAMGKRIVARLRAEHPGAEIRGRVYGTTLLLEALQVPRSEDAGAIWVGDVWLPRPMASRTVVVGIVLEWETGTLRTVGEDGAT